MKHVHSIRARVCAGALALAVSGGSALLLSSPATAASAANQPALATRADQPDVDRAKKFIRCVVIDEERFCTELGFVADGIAKSLDGYLATALGASTSVDGDMGLADLVAQLESLTPQELAERQNKQIADARNAVGRIKLVDAITDGSGLAPGFFAKYPQLGIAEGSRDAAAFRARAVNPDQALLTQPSALTGFRTTASAASAQVSASSLPIVIPTQRDIMYGYDRKQDRNYWCGPATMQSIDWADDGVRDSQATWASASLLGTEKLGYTTIGAMVSVTNSSTSWDTRNGGTYTVVSAANRTLAWFRNLHLIRTGHYGGPTIEHVQALRKFFGYFAFDHGGHYQTGRGYDQSDDTLWIFEPYNEIDYRTGGHVTAGPHEVFFKNMYGATLANPNQNLGA